MPSFTELGNGSKTVFNLPPHNGLVTAKVNGTSATIASQTQMTVTLQTAPVAGATVEILYNDRNIEGAVDAAPAYSVVTITPSDSTDLSANFIRALYVGTAGDVAVVTQDSPTGTAVVFKNVPSGAILPIHVVKVMTTNTTASNILALL